MVFVIRVSNPPQCRHRESCAVDEQQTAQRVSTTDDPRHHGDLDGPKNRVLERWKLEGWEDRHRVLSEADGRGHERIFASLAAMKIPWKGACDVFRGVLFTLPADQEEKMGKIHAPPESQVAPQLGFCTAGADEVECSWERRTNGSCGARFGGSARIHLSIA